MRADIVPAHRRGASAAVGHPALGITMRRQTRRLSVLAIAALACGIFSANAAGEAPAAQTLTLGIITETNRSLTAEHFTDFVRYLAAKLTSGSNIEGKVVIAPTAFNLARLIEQRQVDFYMDSPYPSYLVNDVQGVVKLLLRCWKRGMAEYRSLIFTKQTAQ